MATSPFVNPRSPDFDVDRFVYHYTTAGTARNWILNEKGSLRLGRMANVNDPRESLLGGFALMRGTMAFQDYEGLQQRISEYLTQRTKIACFSRDDFRLATPPQPNPEPFIREYAKPRMWATYGARHKGVCIVFDKSKLITAVQENWGNEAKVWSGNVKYDHFVDQEPVKRWNAKIALDVFSFDVDRLAAEFEEYIEERVFQYFEDYFFSKHEDWSGEREFRLVVYSREIGDICLSNLSSIYGIVAGSECGAGDLEHLVSCANRLGVLIFQFDHHLTGWRQSGRNSYAKHEMGWA